MTSTIRRVLPLLLAFAGMPAMAQQQDGADDRRFLFPIVARAEETGFQTGLLWLNYLRAEDGRRDDSRIQTVALLTEENQYMIAVTALQFFDSHRITLGASARVWPSTFYGIGQDAAIADGFDATASSLRAAYEFALPADFWLGPMIQFERNDITVDEGNSLLTRDSDDRVAGIGLTLSRDLRDDTQYPTSGNYWAFDAIRFVDELGGEFEYDLQRTAFRQYFPLSPRSVIALGAELRNQDGEIPFWDLNTPDGGRLLRGIESGRYRDESLIGRFAWTLFAEMAQVAPSISEFESDAFIDSVGFGLRWQMLPGQPLNLRADVSRVDGDSGFIVNIGEAF